MNFEITATNRRKTIITSLLYFVAFAVLALLLVFLSRGNYNMMLLAAFLFFLGPLGLIYFNKNKFFFSVNLTVTDQSLKITEPGQEEKVILWSTVESWQTEITKSLQGTGYILRFWHHDHSKQTFTFYESLFEANELRNDTALYAICRGIGRYNRALSNGHPITLKPNFFATKPGTIVLTLLGLLIWGDLLLRYEQGKVSGRVPSVGLIVIVLIVALSIFDRKRKGDTTYRQLQALQE